MPTSQAWSRTAQHPLRPVSASCPGHGDICFTRRTLWWLLRLRFQESFQRQGLWPLDSRSWWHDGSDGLPVSWKIYG